MQLYVSYLVQDGSRVLTFCTLTKFKKLHQRGFVWQVVILKIFCMCKNLKNKKKFGLGSHQKKSQCVSYGGKGQQILACKPTKMY